MKHLHFFAVAVILLIFFASCSTLLLDNNQNTPKKRTSITSIAYAAPVIPDIEKLVAPAMKPPVVRSTAQADEDSIRKYNFEFLAVAALLWILLFYRLHQASLQRRKQLKLDNAELALLGLATDTLEDLWRRLQAKTKRKIIPFPRGNS